MAARFNNYRYLSLSPSVQGHEWCLYDERKQKNKETKQQINDITPEKWEHTSKT